MLGQSVANADDVLPARAAASEEAPAPSQVEATANNPGAAKLTVRYGVLAGVPLAVMIYGKEIWQWGERGGWRFGSEGWFGRGTDHGGADKVGHAFGMYTVTRGTTRIMQFTGWDHTRSLWAGALMGTLVGVGVEVGDAYTGRYGFSYEDLVADLSGVALATLLETHPTLDALVGFSIEYFPTNSFLDHPDRRWLEFEGDTGGFNYMLNFRLAGLDHLGLHLPRAFDFFTIDAGYFTRGFSRFDRERGIDQRNRYLFVGASLNVPEVIAALSEPSSSRRFFQDFFSYLHMPIGLKGAASLD